MTMSKISCLPINCVIRNEWPNKYYLVKRDKQTFMLVFSLAQKAEYNFFIKKYEGAILFISPPAVNFSYNHGIDPRNVLIIATDEKSSEEDAVPRVPDPWKG